MSRHNVWIPDDLWSRIQQAAANESAAKGQTVSASEWIREACRQSLGGLDDGDERERSD